MNSYSLYMSLRAGVNLRKKSELEFLYSHKWEHFIVTAPNNRNKKRSRCVNQILVWKMKYAIKFNWIAIWIHALLK